MRWGGSPSVPAKYRVGVSPQPSMTEPSHRTSRPPRTHRKHRAGATWRTCRNTHEFGPQAARALPARCPLAARSSLLAIAACVESPTVQVGHGGLTGSTAPAQRRVLAAIYELLAHRPHARRCPLAARSSLPAIAAHTESPTVQAGHRGLTASTAPAQRGVFAAIYYLLAHGPHARRCLLAARSSLLAVDRRRFCASPSTDLLLRAHGR